jgi:hypothetical protein
MTVRYAIYHAPEPSTPLWRFGSGVLGYDAATGAEVPALLPKGFSAEAWHAATEEPRRYGFHATIKAPFRLAADRSEAELVAALTIIAGRLDAVDLGACGVHVVPAEAGGGFVAVTPVTPPPALAALERAVVTEFEPFRAPLTQEETLRRRPERLSPRQRGHLERYGYPYVLEDFAFHMTLSGRLDAPEPVAADLGDWARAAGALDGGVAVERLALFRQDGAAARFRIIAGAALRREEALLPPHSAER